MRLSNPVQTLSDSLRSMPLPIRRETRCTAIVVVGVVLRLEAW